MHLVRGQRAKHRVLGQSIQHGTRLLAFPIQLVDIRPVTAEKRVIPEIGCKLLEFVPVGFLRERSQKLQILLQAWHGRLPNLSTKTGDF